MKSFLQLSGALLECLLTDELLAKLQSMLDAAERDYSPREFQELTDVMRSMVNRAQWKAQGKRNRRSSRVQR